jgi:[ribosomal protein S5]-alanine N-acetyltransferase
VAISNNILTDRIKIVPFEEKHITSEYIEWLNDPEIVAFSEQRHQEHTIETCKKYVSSFKNAPNYFWALIATDDAVGHFGNINAYIDQHNSLADVGIIIGNRFVWGKGYGFEAWKGVCNFLFQDIGIRKITAGTLSVNKAMLNVMRKNGMIKDGVRSKHYLWHDQEVDIVYYSLFRTHWLKDQYISQ